MSKHTPGPWYVTQRGFITDEFGRYILIRSPWEEAAFVGLGTEANDLPATDAEVEANARLIAAAPELLEACQLTLQLQASTYGMAGDKTELGYMLHRDAVVALQAAIAKAIREEP